MVSVADGDDLAKQIVQRQLETLHHRGPDSYGIYQKGPAALGQARLAVLDLDTGDPPITNEDATLGVALNGEIYDFAGLREAAIERGHSFKTTGDTEVIAHLAEDFQPLELCKQLDGMFAFAIWDDRKQRFILARDRCGKKPIYWWFDGKTLVFGSEIKAVVAHPQVPRRLNRTALASYLQLGYAPSPITFFEGVNSLLPGHVLVWEPGSEPKIERYWEQPIAGINCETLDISFDEAAAEVRKLVTQAVGRRMVADVPLGGFLSGGVDSSAIVTAMSQLSSSKVKTFTVGFDEGRFDERSPARETAERLGTEHHEFVANPKNLDLLEKLVWHHDQPFGDSSAIPTYLLCEQTAQQVTVALSGDGGDELFAGYERFFAARAVEGFSRIPGVLKRSGLRVAERFDDEQLRGRVGSAKRFAYRADQGLPAAYQSWISYVPAEFCDQLYGDLYSQQERAFGDHDYQQIWDESKGSQRLNRLLHTNFRTYLLDDLLPKADRMSMAHSLEVRSPLLDSKLIEFAARLPVAHKQKGFKFKRVLREAFSDVLPPDLLSRRKQGFGVPLDQWFREDWKSYAESMLLSSDSRVSKHLTVEGVKAVMDEHQSGNRSLGHAIWTLLTLEIFLRREGW